MSGDNVTPLHGGAAKLKPRAEALLGLLRPASDIRPVLERPYLVKGWLDRGGVSILFGASNVGKSFLALDLAHHVSKGRKWGGRRVNAGRVIYIAAEGGGNFDNRVAALDGPEMWVLSGAPFAMTGKASAAPPMAEVLKHLEGVGGAPFDLIVLDTMARVMGGADENAAPDIADLMRNVEVLVRATGAHVLLVHHTGKDQARGARGHSSLRAAIDTEIELTRDEWGLITAEVTKQRDGPTGYSFAYTLRQVELGQDQDGDPVTTCVVEPAEPAEAGRAACTGAARKALGVLEALVATAGEVIRNPKYPGSASVPLDAWRDACLEGDLSTSEKRNTQLRAFRRSREELENARLIVVRDERVWRVE